METAKKSQVTRTVSLNIIIFTGGKGQTVGQRFVVTSAPANTICCQSTVSIGYKLEQYYLVVCLFTPLTVRRALVYEVNKVVHLSMNLFY